MGKKFDQANMDFNKALGKTIRMARQGARSMPHMISREEAGALLAQLAATGNYSFSPSGKTILTEISQEDIRTRLG